MTRQLLEGSDKKLEVRLAEARPSTSTLSTVLKFFDAIDLAGEAAGRWWLERQLSMNTSALNRWLTSRGGLAERGYVVEVNSEDGSKVVKKTRLGENFHGLLKNVEPLKILGDVIKHYSGERLKH